jgi:RimJ/RimL family protein N-acetyltransferase
MILAGQKQLVAAWVASRIKDMRVPPEKDYEAIGVIGKGGELIGGVIYTEYREIAPGQHDIRMHCAGEPGWLTRQTLKLFFSYPFIQLNCIRVTSTVAKGNKRARTLNERLGFEIEGCIRDGYGLGRDGIIYGLRRQDCRWIEDDRRGKIDPEGPRSLQGVGSPD